MYQLWRFLKRGIVYNPQMVVGITLGYFTAGVIGSYVPNILAGTESYLEHHSGSYHEENRKYFIEQAIKTREEVYALRQQRQ